MAGTTTNKPSAEQQGIIDAVKEGFNVMCNAAPGSGKTTLAIHTLSAIDDTSAIILTYNRALADSTRKRVQALQQSPTDPLAQKKVLATTYHAMMSKVVGRVVSDDFEFREQLHKLTTPNDETGSIAECPAFEHDDFTVLIVDETQDVRPDFMKFIIFMCTKACKDPDNLTILVCGDDNQALYHFFPVNGSDARFLTMFDDLVGRREHKAVADKAVVGIVPSDPAYDQPGQLTTTKPERYQPQRLAAHH